VSPAIYISCEYDLTHNHFEFDGGGGIKNIKKEEEEEEDDDDDVGLYHGIMGLVFQGI
jgi:hypothetical protein